MRLIISFILSLSLSIPLIGQTGSISGQINSEGNPLEFVNIGLKNTAFGGLTNEKGEFKIENIPFGEYKMIVSIIGFQTIEKDVIIDANQPDLVFSLEMAESSFSMDEVVISGTMKEVNKLDSPVPVEVYSAEFFQANPTPSIFESLQNVNGVRPQLNCNVCNTGDIHINGLEGPYTMVLIDGMPIVSGLSTVYGLTGIPQSLIERVEIVKGPASTLYGSEAVGGLINIITKKPLNVPVVSADVFASSWQEVNADLGVKFRLGKRVHSLMGVNYFNYDNPIDNNGDNFTDVTLQNRVSIFNKISINREDKKAFSIAGRYVYEDRWGGEMNWELDNPIDNNGDNFTDVTLQNRVSIFNKISINREDKKAFSIAGRYVYEDRWGGEMNWEPKYRGGEEVYGESIYTSRWETFGIYQLPVREMVNFQFSLNGHNQNSVYGNTEYIADQYIGFGQLTWNKELGEKHDLLVGAAYRYTYYDDNTPATADFQTETNQPSAIHLPGLFAQNEVKLNDRNKLLLGMRYDYNSHHGNIFSPRINYKWNSSNNNNVFRLSAGNGYRVANVFTEDHAALTGSQTQ